MQNNTIHKVPTIDGIDELPDFNILLANFIENFHYLLPPHEEKINTSGRKTTVESLRGFFDPLEISELTGHANPSSIQFQQFNAYREDFCLQTFLLLFKCANILNKRTLCLCSQQGSGWHVNNNR